MRCCRAVAQSLQKQRRDTPDWVHRGDPILVSVARQPLRLWLGPLLRSLSLHREPEDPAGAVSLWHLLEA